MVEYCTEGYYIDDLGLQQPLPRASPPACYAADEGITIGRGPSGGATAGADASRVCQRCPTNLLVGSEWKLAEDDASAIEAALATTKWPNQVRRSVSGFGTCLGLTNGPKGAYVGAYTNQCQSLVRLINKIITNLVDDDFHWTSIQVNHNSVSTKHCDQNNDGLSGIMLFGNFSEGYFVSEDADLRTNTTRTLHLFDGCEPHFSTKFVGERFSVVLYLSLLCVRAIMC